MPLDRDKGAPSFGMNPSIKGQNFSPGAKLDTSRVSDLSQQQMQNAAIIYQVGRSMGMSTRDIQIGIITAMVESNLVNVNYGDRDSLGLFQQRPSQGWGTPEQVTDPQYAAKKFFETLKGLGEKRYDMGMGEAAQAVQRSAFPERYAERIGAMRGMWPSIQKVAGDNPKSLDGGDYGGSSPFPDAPPLPPGTYTTGDTAVSGSNLGSTFNYGSLTEGGVTGGATPAAAGMNQPLTPTASQMLGAWGMGGNNVTSGMGSVTEVSQQAPPLAPELDVAPLIGPGTNETVIQPMSQTSGTFEKGVDGWRKAVIEYARTAVGVPYVWGGTNLQSGVDCSGLLQAAFAKAGISIPRVSYQQANYGTRVGLDALQAGDLVAWNNSSRNPGADHIALFLGNGMILEAAKPGTVVRIRAVSDGEGAYGVKLNVGK